MEAQPAVLTNRRLSGDTVWISNNPTVDAIESAFYLWISQQSNQVSAADCTSEHHSGPSERSEYEADTHEVNADGANTDGANTDGANTDGANTDGANTDGVHEEGNDSGYEDDDVFSFTSTTTVINQTWCEENGRGYIESSFPSDPISDSRVPEYWGPHDIPAQQNQVLADEVWTLALDGDLTMTTLESPQNIIDLGTGTGDWAIKMGLKHPSASVCGIDMAAIQPIEVPPNVGFLVDDYNSSDYGRNRFDLVHGRELLGSVVNWPGFIDIIFMSLKPGGWVELHEPSLYIQSDAQNSCLLEWASELIEAGKKTGMIFDVCSKLEGWLREAGFINVEVKKEAVPIGGGTELGKKNLKRWVDGLDDISLRPFRKVLKKSDIETTVFLAFVRNELRKGATQELYFVRAQKPF